VSLHCEAYSPKCLECAFCEIRLYGVLFDLSLADGRMRRDPSWCTLRSDETSTLGGSRDR